MTLTCFGCHTVYPTRADRDERCGHHYKAAYELADNELEFALRNLEAAKESGDEEWLYQAEKSVRYWTRRKSSAERELEAHR